jgi:ABC-2 type transport system permease protein
MFISHRCIKTNNSVSKVKERKMITNMFLFEWRYFTRQPSFYVSAIIFFSMAFFTSGFNKLEDLFGSNIFINGPFFITKAMGVLTFFSLFLVITFVANTAMRDKLTEMDEILYCKPINPLSYQLGRFLGSFAVVLTVSAVIPLGMFLGSVMPWVTETRLGPINFNYYFSAFVYISVPTLLVFSCLFYTIAVRTKSMMAVYLTVVAVFILNTISEAQFMQQDVREIAALLDPFGNRTFLEISRYWTVFEKNNEVITLTGDLLLNRILWLIISGSILVFFGQLTKKMLLTPTKSLKKKDQKTSNNEVSAINFQDHHIYYKGYANATLQQFLVRVKFEIKQVITTPSFLILCSFMLFVMIAVLLQPKGMFGSTDLPFTQFMVQVIIGSMKVLSIIIITYYSAEVVWRERSSTMGDIIDSMPVSNMTFWLSKMVAVWLVLILLLVFGMAVAIIYQLANGFIQSFEQLQLSQYLVSLFYFTALPVMMLTVLAFLLQIISPNKYLGMFLFILFYISSFVMEPLGLGHNMFNFSKSPVMNYSDLNGYGWSIVTQNWYMLYWGALTLVMSIVGFALWQRGNAVSLKKRFKNIGYQIGNKGRIALATSCLVFVLSGTNIYYNTQVVNQYTSVEKQNEMYADYEKQFSQYAELPVPVITKLNAAVDIYPKELKVEASVEIEIFNKSEQPINRFLVSTIILDKFNLDIEGGKLGPLDPIINNGWFEFDKPLMPGEKRQGRFELIRQLKGFSDKRMTTNIVENGTFFNNSEMFPVFGYQKFAELTSSNLRKKYNLPPAKRAHKLEQSEFYNETIMGPSAGYLAFKTTVSTSIDQTAIAPGYLQKEWTEGDRRYFHYKMDAPIENFFSYISGRFESLKSKYNGVDIEIYYHKNHNLNVDRMAEGIKDSIDYFSDNFGAYQHKQARIIEIPRYYGFAQSFPNTIAFSERIGFITDMRNENEVDQIYYVTAHEMAHQWWGGQVDGANVQGSTMITETLSQYSALMLTTKKYGKKKVRSILITEMDKYFSGRSSEAIEEVALMRVENQQYIHYRKGAVVMMSLVDLLGEERMNNALSRFIKQFKFSEGIHPTTLDLQSFISQGANKDELSFIKSVFEEINLYDLKAKSVDIKALDNEQFEVTLTVEAHIANADGQGVETEMDLSQMINIGLFLDDPDDLSVNNPPLYLKKHLITSGKNIITLIVDKRPIFAGIDPFVTLIDRDSADNLIKL